MNNEKNNAAPDPQPAELAEQGQRERFEAWAKSTGLETKIYAHNNMYSHPVTRGAWIAWESLASTQPVANDPVGYEYRFWNPDAKGGDGAWSGWGPIRKADYERELVEPVGGREVRALYVAKPDGEVDGYQRAFYELADMLDMGAQPISPKQAWETQMRPMLQAALAARQPVGEPVAFMVRMRAEGGFGLVRLKDMPYYRRHANEYEIVPLYAAPPAQGIDLGQQRPLIARSLAEWHEDDGNVMWWAWCGRDWAGEPAWCGTPNDSDWPGYHTHWTQHHSQPALIDQRDAAPGLGE